jgi:DNA-binding PadR family transcriptional regulator
MPAAQATAGEFDPRLCEPFQALVGQVRSAARQMKTGHHHSTRTGPWDRGRTRPKGPWDWRGGPGSPGGPWGGWWPGGPPGSPRGPKAGRGDVRAAILALLQEGPRNGYQIMSEIEERSDGAWRPSPGAVYPALSQLADEGLIEAEESGGKRTFRLTEEGRQYVQDHPEAARAAWESMTQGPGEEVPGLFVQAARLGGAIVQMAREGTPRQVHEAETLLEQARRTMYQILADEDHGEE